MDDGSIKQRMKDLREREHLTQAEMAERLGMSLRAYNALETGDTHIFHKKLEEFAAITQTGIEEIVIGTGRDSGDRTLKDSFEYLREKDLRRIAEYERMLEMERRTIEQQKELIVSLQAQLKDKQKLISLLEKQMGND